MSKIFVSCGQFTKAEKFVGKEIVRIVKAVTGIDAFFAEEVQDLNGLDSNILGALRECVGFITVIHPRGENHATRWLNSHSRLGVDRTGDCDCNVHPEGGKKDTAGHCVHPQNGRT